MRATGIVRRIEDYDIIGQTPEGLETWGFR